MRRNKYDAKKTIRKAVEIFLYAGAGAVISYLTELPQTETVVLVIALLTALRNYLKHKL